MRRAWSLLILSLPALCLGQTGSSLQNVTIETTAPQIVYTPFLCDTNNSTVAGCEHAWQLVDVDGTTAVSSTSPSSSGSSFLPQMFFQFRASSLFISTSPLSNATMNVTLSAGDTVIEVTLNSSVGIISIVNLVEAEVTTLSITFIDGEEPSRLDIGALWITVANASSSSSFLPTMTLPPTIIVPTSIPTASTSGPSPTTSSTPPSDSSSRNRNIALAIGLTLGLGLGLTALSVAGFLAWRWRRRKRKTEAQSGLTGLPVSPKERSWF